VLVLLVQALVQVLVQALVLVPVKVMNHQSPLLFLLLAQKQKVKVK